METTKRRDALGIAALLTVVLAPVLRAGLTGRWRVEDDAFAQAWPITSRLLGDLPWSLPPSWVPEVFLGYPLLGSIEAQAFSPLNIPFALASPEVAMVLRAGLAQTLATVGAFALLRTLGSGRGGALFGALAWGAGAHFHFMLVETSALLTVAWFPTVLLALTRALRGGGLGWWVGSALALGSALLGGHVQLAYLFGLFVVAYALGLDALEGRMARRGWLGSRLPPALGVALLSAGLAMPALLPTWHLARDSVRNDLARSERLAYAPPPEVVPAWLLPGLAMKEDRDNAYASAGALPLALALLGAAAGPGPARALLWLGAGFGTLALGASFGPSAWVLEHLPGYDFRHSIRIALLANLSIALAAGLGLDVLVRGRGPRRRWLDWVIPALLGATCLLALRLCADAAAALWTRAPVALGVEVAATFTGLALVPTRRWFPDTIGRLPGAAAWAVAMLTIGAVPSLARSLTPPVADEGTLLAVRYGRTFDRAAPEGWSAPPSFPEPIRGRVSAPDGSGPVRTAVLSPVEQWGHNAALFGTHQEPFGYLSLVPLRLQRVAWGGHDVGVATAVPPTHPVYRSRRLLELLNVRFLVVLAPGSGWWTGLVPSGLAQLRAEREALLFENPGYLPRCYFVSRAELAADEEAAFDRLMDETFDPRQAVLLEGEPTLPSDAGTPRHFRACRVTSYGEEQVRLEVDAPTAGWAVLLDRHHPGWTASVDGRPTPVRRANYLFRAVRVEAGSSRVEYRFSDAAVRRGLGIAGATFALCLGVLVSARRRR